MKHFKRKPSKRGKKAKEKSLHCSSEINKRKSKLDMAEKGINILSKLFDLLPKIWKLTKPILYWLLVHITS